MIWCSRIFDNFPQFLVVHTVTGFSIVDEAEVDVYLKFSCFFYDPMDVGTLTSGSSAFFKSSLNICMGDECNCLMFEHSLELPFLGTGMRELTSSSPVATAGSSRFADILSATL